MMVGGSAPVNARNGCSRMHPIARRPATDGATPKKKPGSIEPGLKYWPCEADTITFQEGLLSFRATGGGGQMRNANTQRPNSMVLADGLQQLGCKHVSHAETGG
jgi:hypothetical protein